jgi:protease-4
MAQSKALRDELKVLKSGKFVMAYANSYTQEYYLNSVASPIYINPVGYGFQLSAELCFLRIFRKNRSKMEVRHGKYKSAVEPFLKMK